MHLGPYHAALIINYRGHGKRWGRINFANGFTLRAGRVALLLVIAVSAVVAKFIGFGMGEGD